MKNILIVVLAGVAILLALDWWCNRGKKNVVPDHSAYKAENDSLKKALDQSKIDKTRYVDSLMIGYFEKDAVIEELSKRRVVVQGAAEISRLKGELLILKLKTIPRPPECDSLATEFTKLSNSSRQADFICDSMLSNRSGQIEDLKRINAAEKSFGEQAKTAFDIVKKNYDSLYKDYVKYTARRVQVFAGPAAMFAQESKTVYFGAEIAVKDKRNRIYSAGAVYNKQTHFFGGVKFLITLKK